MPFSRTSRPSPVTATVGTIGTPSVLDSWSTSRSPRLRATSIMFRATSMGYPSSISWAMSTIPGSSRVASATTITRSGLESLSMCAATIWSSAPEDSEYSPGRSMMVAGFPAMRISPLRYSTVVPG
ncbi:MAG: hypothetical protein A4E29_00494 [Methanomassiliicoccales archaeon PtaB.Bin134]|nr:MAG: hypothetical protein A4E29_00494 [Methanomassiliicoccales archaeon PtaB.Bin134]